MSIQDESVPPDFDLDCSAVDNVNQSTSLPINDKYESTKSTNACSSSEISGQTNASEPADVAGDRYPKTVLRIKKFSHIFTTFQKALINVWHILAIPHLRPFPIRTYTRNTLKNVLNMWKAKSLNT